MNPAGWTLRARLLAALIGLLATVSVVIALVSVLALQGFMTSQLDRRLHSAVSRSQVAVDRPPPTTANGDAFRGPGFLGAPGQSEGTLGTIVRPGQAPQGAVLDPSGHSHALESLAYPPLLALPRDGSVHTVDLIGLGSYRVAAATAPNGDVVITGLPLDPVTSTVTRLALIITVVALIGLVAAAFAGAAIIRLSLRPLRRMSAIAARVAELPLDRGEVALAVRVPDESADVRTEVGQLGASFNRMLGHISNALHARQASEARMRRFVADASHELRTPLASIRGYAELTRRRQSDLDPDVANALRRVESEAIRMTGLVEDLLLLARLDEGRPLVSAPVDVSMLVVDAVSDAQAAGPDHQWSLELPEEPLSVIGDSGRLHQVIVNLLGNARVHTPAGTAVAVHLDLDEEADEAVLRVVDDGPGIPDVLLPDVFNRFSRGDSSRSRAAGSTGLGLSIVASVVQAHHGRVEVTSRPGRTEFAVRLPLALAPVLA